MDLGANIKKCSNALFKRLYLSKNRKNYTFKKIFLFFKIVTYLHINKTFSLITLDFSPSCPQYLSNHMTKLIIHECIRFLHSFIETVCFIFGMFNK